MSKDPVVAPSQAQHNQTCLLSLRRMFRQFAVVSPGNGGARRDRTDDILLAKQALSQLSYGPITETKPASEELVGPGRLELPTSRLSGVRSNHLSYGPPGIRLDRNSTTDKTVNQFQHRDQLAIGINSRLAGTSRRYHDILDGQGQRKAKQTTSACV